jgi:hypothetical protein
MYVFVVIPAPERAEMVPRTYDTLATLGQQNGMTGQVKMIEEATLPPTTRAMRPPCANGFGRSSQSHSYLRTKNTTAEMLRHRKSKKPLMNG